MKKNKLPLYNSKYQAAIGISKFIIVIGWFLVAIGSASTLISIVTSLNAGTFDIIILLSLGILISGLFLVLGAQVSIAVIDNADHTRLILKILNRNK